ncbi:MAG: glycosyltransferase [Polyangiales bacterium]
MQVALIVPCYNEEKRLDQAAFLSALSAQENLRIRFVNDGSRDGTLDVLRELQNVAPPFRVEVLDLPQNVGKAEAVRQGLLHEFDSVSPKAEFLGYWDADLATPLEELPTFVSILDERPHTDLVIGSRIRLLGRHIERKFYRHAYGRVFATVVSEMLQLPVCDTQCGAKLLRSNAAMRAALSEPFMSRWVFDVEMLARLIIAWNDEGLDAKEKIVEQPLMRWTDIPGSKIGISDAVRAIYEVGRIEKRYGRRLRR